jgi:hypothetical protein
VSHLSQVLAPLLLPMAAAATPGVAQSLQQKLEESGLDAEGLNARLAKVLGEKA